MAKDESDLVFIKGQMLLNVLRMKKYEKISILTSRCLNVKKLHILVQKFSLMI